MLTIQEVQLSNGIKSFKDLYKDDKDFVEAYKVCSNFQNHFHSAFSNYTLQSRLLLKRNQLCVPKGSMREDLIQENNNGNLSGYFGVSKTMEVV